MRQQPGTSHIVARREGLVADWTRDERRAGHADAEARARILMAIQDALDARTLTVAAGMAAIGRPGVGALLQSGTLATADLTAIRVAVEALTSSAYRYAMEPA